MTTSLDLAAADLVALVGRDTVLKRHGRTIWRGPCPLCGAGTDRFKVEVSKGDDGKDEWHCHVCKEGGDAIHYLRRKHGLSFGEALRTLGVAAVAQAPLAPPEPEPVAAPAEAWQFEAGAWVDDCAADLWADVGAKALGWLRARGLTDATIQVARLGYNAHEQHVDPAWLGLDQQADVWLPRGIVIPWYVGGALWKVNIRRPTGKPKYIPLPGGCGNCMYNTDALAPGFAAILVEGEFNALILAQEAGDLAAPVALGAATHGRRARWQIALSHAAPLIVALDNDDDVRKGEQAARYWVDLFPRQALRWAPTTKDPNQMHVDGISLHGWVEAGIAAGVAHWEAGNRAHPAQTDEAPVEAPDLPSAQDVGVDIAGYVDASGAVDQEAFEADVRAARLVAAVGLPLADPDAPLPRWAQVLADSASLRRQREQCDRLEDALDVPRLNDGDADAVLVDGAPYARRWRGDAVVAVGLAQPRAQTQATATSGTLKLKPRELAEAVEKWETCGSLGLGALRARLGCDYGQLLAAVRAEQTRRETEEQGVIA